MAVKLKSTAGGSVTLDVPSTASDFLLNLPAVGGNVVTTGDSGTVTPAMLSTGRPNWDSSGNLQFNSGYGSVASAYGVRAWVHFDAAGGTPSIVTSGNVSAVADLGVGSYRIDFDVDLPDGDFAISATSSQTINRPSAPSGASVTLQTGYASSTGGAVANVDANNVTVMVVR